MNRLKPTTRTRRVRFCLLVIAVAIVSWIARGTYDKHFMMEGRLHVVNNSGRDRDVMLTFPSGKHLEFFLGKGTSRGYRISDTGEGAIAVRTDGGSPSELGYVTSMNGVIILALGEDKAEFSQIFPSIEPEKPVAESAERPG